MSNTFSQLRSSLSTLGTAFEAARARGTPASAFNASLPDLVAIFPMTRGTSPADATRSRPG